MARQGKGGISWTDETWSPVTGCSKVSEGCQNCYAEAMARRFKKDWKPWTAANAEHNVRLHPERLEQPLRWRKPRRIFVASMGDLFHDEVPWPLIDQVFAVMGMASQHTFQVLTKRPRKMRGYFLEPNVHNNVELSAEKIKSSTGSFSPKHVFPWPLPNVWLGVSIENQRTADERIPLLLQTPAALRFVSIEPMLGPVDFSDAPLDPESMMGPWTDLAFLDWVIVGGESGPRARLMKTEWARSVRDQCQEAGVKYFFKGWGKYCETDQLPEETWARLDAAVNLGGQPSYIAGVGKKAAGRELDGREWNEAPG